MAQKLQSIKSLQALCLVNCTIDVQALTKSPIFHRLKALYISSQESGDDILEGLSEDCALTKLDIWGTQISDRGLKNLSRCHNLKTVYLSGTPVTNDSITALASIKSLESLVIRQVRISPGVVGHLKALKHIPEVYIDLTNLNYSDRTALLKEMKNLKALDPRKEPLSQFAAE